MTHISLSMSTYLPCSSQSCGSSNGSGILVASLSRLSRLWLSIIPTLIEEFDQFAVGEFLVIMRSFKRFLRETRIDNTRVLFGCCLGFQLRNSNGIDSVVGHKIFGLASDSSRVFVPRCWIYCAGFPDCTWREKRLGHWVMLQASPSSELHFGHTLNLPKLQICFTQRVPLVCVSFCLDTSSQPEDCRLRAVAVCRISIDSSNLSRLATRQKIVMQMFSYDRKSLPP